MDVPEDQPVVLRQWNLTDAPELAALANNPAIARFMTDAFPHPYTVADAERFIGFARSHEPARIFAVIYGGSLAGGIGLHVQQDISRKNAELGYWVAEPYWGRGIATMAVKLATQKGFSELGVVRIFARPFGHNLASQKVLQKCGFVLEATIKDGFFKEGRFTDEHLYAIRRPEH
jgi:RimJ/RimL family protein N-acetyltransferase